MQKSEVILTFSTREKKKGPTGTVYSYYRVPVLYIYFSKTAVYPTIILRD